MSCERCGCTELEACPDDGTGGPCAWVRPGLCSACATDAELDGAALELDAPPAPPLLYDAYGGVLVR